MRPDAKHRAFQHGGGNRDNSGRDSYKIVRKDGFNEESPTKERMRLHYGTYGKGCRQYDYKFIKKFLVGSVGKHWDDVYSELCRVVDIRLPGAAQLREDINQWQIASFNVTEKDGKVYTDNRRGWGRCGELFDKDLYVDANGVLRQYKKKYKRVAPWKPHVKYPLTHTSFGDFLFMDGLWYRVKMVEPRFYKQERDYGWRKYKEQYTMAKDIILNLINDGNHSRSFYDPKRMYSYSGYSKDELVSTYGEPKVCVQKLSANKQEIKKLKKLLK